MAMPKRYLFIATMNVDAGKDALFNEVYDKEHIPNLRKVPGVISVARFKKRELKLRLGGETRTIVIQSEPSYHAMYELEGPEVLTSDAFAEAVDKGRWPSEVRPYTRDRRHVLLERV
jgi:hypothetical protein